MLRGGLLAVFWLCAGVALGAATETGPRIDVISPVQDSVLYTEGVGVPLRVGFAVDIKIGQEDFDEFLVKHEDSGGGVVGGLMVNFGELRVRRRLYDCNAPSHTL